MTTMTRDAMKVTLDRAALAEASAWVAGAVSKNPPRPEYAGLLIEASGGQVTITGYGGDTLHQATIVGDEAEFTALVSARFLTSIVAAMKGTTVDLEVHDGRFTVSSGRASYGTRVMVVGDYPALPTFPTHVGTIAADALSDVLGTVEHAVSKDQNLRALAAFNIAGEAGVLTVTTTDRFRMARATSKWADASAAAFEVNVPATALGSAVKSLRGDVQIGAADGLFGVCDEGRVVITRILGTEDKFPRTAPLFAKEPVTHVECDVATLAEALKRSLLVADETGMVFVEFSDGLIRVLGDGKTSDGVEEVDCGPGFGEGAAAYKFNAAYVMQALLASPAPRVTFGLTAPGKQVLIEPCNVPSVTLIVMPRSS